MSVLTASASTPSNSVGPNGASSVINNTSDPKLSDPKLSVFCLSNDKNFLYYLSRTNTLTKFDLTLKDYSNPLPTQKDITNAAKPQLLQKVAFQELSLERAGNRVAVDSLVVSNESMLYLMGYCEHSLVFETFALRAGGAGGTAAVSGRKSVRDQTRVAKAGLLEAVGGMAVLIALEPLNQAIDENAAKITLSLMNHEAESHHVFNLPPSDEKGFELDAIDIQEQAINKAGYGNVALTLIFLLVSNNSNSDLYSLCVFDRRIWLQGVFREVFGPKRDRTPFMHSLTCSDEGLIAISANDRQIRKFKLLKNT